MITSAWPTPYSLRLPRLAEFAGALGLCCATLGAPAAIAQDSSALIPKVQHFDDLPDTLKMEETIHAYGVSGDISGVKKLAETIRSDDGATLSELMAISQWASEQAASGGPDALAAGKDWMKDPRAKVILAMGPCHYAGMLARQLALGLADGSMKPVQRNGRTMVDGTVIDTAFSTQMSRCQQIRGKVSSPDLARTVGDMCELTGAGCGDDPDFAEE